jgi:hypothetical protein
MIVFTSPWWYEPNSRTLHRAAPRLQGKKSKLIGSVAFLQQRRPAAESGRDGYRRRVPAAGPPNHDDSSGLPAERGPHLTRFPFSFSEYRGRITPFLNRHSSFSRKTGRSTSRGDSPDGGRRSVGNQRVPGRKMPPAAAAMIVPGFLLTWAAPACPMLIAGRRPGSSLSRKTSGDAAGRAESPRPKLRTVEARLAWPPAGRE